MVYNNNGEFELDFLLQVIGISKHENYELNLLVSSGCWVQGLVIFLFFRYSNGDIAWSGLTVEVVSIMCCLSFAEVRTLSKLLCIRALVLMGLILKFRLTACSGR